METELAGEKQQRKMLETQLQSVQETNGDLLNRLEDLAVISKEGATSIREGLESINDQTGYIRDLNRAVARKDSVNNALKINLIRSLNSVSSSDVQVDIRGGKVHVSISDKLLFSSASARLNGAANQVLEKVSIVLNEHRELDVMVEGHTDNVPVNSSSFNDNWELSTARATAVVRQLVNEYYVDPGRLTAAGRAEHDPRGNNETAEGRARNRRTEIVITPRLDEFLELSEAPEEAG
ncbi:MAG: OmpA family protein [Bacteroidota bacterium]